MSELNLNFDKFVERRGTDSIKYDAAELFGKPKDLLSFWVADMDFKTSSYVQDATREVVERGVFGYSTPSSRYYDAVGAWMKERHAFEPTREGWLITPGVVFAVTQCVRAFTEPGDPVLIQEPVYYPFANTIRANRRVVVSNDLVLRDDGRYEIDFDDFERKIVENKIKLFILCSPHNPVGRVWTREELERLGDLCVKHDVLVLADEIHHDFVFQGRHRVFETLAPEFARRCVTCTSPSKTFNLAGLQISNIFVSNPELCARLRAEIESTGYCEPNIFGLAACRAAYEKGAEWFDAALRYIEGNIDYAVDFINAQIPYASARKNEGTYLVWANFRETGWSAEELERVVLLEARLWLDPGTLFGASGSGFERINVACQRSYLEKGLNALREAVINAAVAKAKMNV